MSTLHNQAREIERLEAVVAERDAEIKRLREQVEQSERSHDATARELSREIDKNATLRARLEKAIEPGSEEAKLLASLIDAGTCGHSGCDGEQYWAGDPQGCIEGHDYWAEQCQWHHEAGEFCARLRGEK